MRRPPAPRSPSPVSATAATPGAFVERLFASHSVAVGPGRFFDSPAHFRISFGGATEAIELRRRALPRYASAAWRGSRDLKSDIALEGRPSLPLDRGGGLRRDVVDDAVDAADGPHDARAIASRTSCGMRNQSAVMKSTVWTARTARTNSCVRLSPMTPTERTGQEDGEGLRDGVVEPGRADLVEHDLVGLLEDRDLLARHFAGDPHGETRPRERVPRQELARQAELGPERRAPRP